MVVAVGGGGFPAAAHLCGGPAPTCRCREDETAAFAAPSGGGGDLNRQSLGASTVTTPRLEIQRLKARWRRNAAVPISRLTVRLIMRTPWSNICRHLHQPVRSAVCARNIKPNISPEVHADSSQKRCGESSRVNSRPLTACSSNTLGGTLI